MTKKKLNLSVDTDLHKAIKHIAINEDATVSELIEEYIRDIQKNNEIIKVIKDMSKDKKLKKVKQNA